VKAFLAAAALLAALWPCQPANQTCAWSADQEVEACYTDRSVTIERWGGEISARLDAPPDSTLYPIPDGSAFEVATTLHARPASNVLHYHFTTNAVAWYQPFLANTNLDGDTWEPNPYGGMRVRPAHINGSYALYHPTRSGDYSALGWQNYRAGKFLHIDRPWATDAEGHFTWAELAIIGDDLQVIVPQAFLDVALYPVVVDPTFGYSGTAASDDNPGSAHLLFKATSTPASTGTLTSVTTKGRIRFGAAPEHCPAIYSGTSAPADKLAGVETGTAYTGSDAEVTTNLSYGSLGNGTQYWLGTKVTGGGGSLDSWIKYDATGGTANMYFKVYGGGDTTAWEADSTGYSSADNEKAYIYGTYTATGGTCVPMLALLGVGSC